MVCEELWFRPIFPIPLISLHAASCHRRYVKLPFEMLCGHLIKMPTTSPLQFIVCFSFKIYSGPRALIGFLLTGPEEALFLFRVIPFLNLDPSGFVPVCLYNTLTPLSVHSTPLFIIFYYPLTLILLHFISRFTNFALI